MWTAIFIAEVWKVKASHKQRHIKDRTTIVRGTEFVNGPTIPPAVGIYQNA